MAFRTLLILVVALLLAPATQAQSVHAASSQEEDQSETMRDTLKRMQIKREEEEHKKLVEKGEQIKREAEELLKAVSGERLPRLTEKKLKEIEKFARQIRSESGGSQDVPLETPPKNLEETLKQLVEVSERLNTGLAKTSRRVVSLSVVENTTDIIQLVKLLRGYLN